MAKLRPVLRVPKSLIKKFDATDGRGRRKMLKSNATLKAERADAHKQKNKAGAKLRKSRESFYGGKSSNSGLMHAWQRKARYEVNRLGITDPGRRNSSRNRDRARAIKRKM